MDRVIFHVDMDAFFAAVEQRDCPDYRDKPVIVGADPKGGKAGVWWRPVLTRHGVLESTPLYPLAGPFVYVPMVFICDLT
jgi:hypothetical protein